MIEFKNETKKEMIDIMIENMRNDKYIRIYGENGNTKFRLIINNEKFTYMLYITDKKMFDTWNRSSYIEVDCGLYLLDSGDVSNMLNNILEIFN